MGKICVCFILSSDTSEISCPDKFEQNYQRVYKPAISFLYAHQNCFFSFSFTGDQISWCKKKRPEFLDLVSQLSSRKQIEVLGGGYYNPVFPLLNSPDRSGQIEMLSSELRQTMGKRPRGLVLCASSWDPSLVSGFQTCGMEYVLLDSSLIPPSKQFYLPVIMSDKGKSLNIISGFRNFLPNLAFSPEQYLQNLYTSVTHSTESDRYSQRGSDRIVTVLLGKKLFSQMLESGWFETLTQHIQNKFSDSMCLSTPLSCIKNATQYVPGYIPAGLSSDIAQWLLVPYTSVKNRENFPVTIHDFLEAYPLHKALYDRMLYVSMLVNQCHGDKMRKKAARDKLWEAQDGKAFICSSSGALANSARRQLAFKNLTEAEKLVRECSDFHESITSFDYNGDGVNEYICQMEQYNSCISLSGGSIFELDIMRNAGNYADNLSRNIRFDGCDDGYYRGLFVDHLLENAEFEQYINHKAISSGIFSKTQFSQNVFNSQRHEIQLYASEIFSSMRQNVSLRKNYLTMANGFTVQYILKNESPIAIDAKLVIESNFTQTEAGKLYRLEVVAAGQHKELDAYSDENTVLRDISAVQITDTESNISFIFEPNENAGLTFAPILFMRPDAFGNIVPAGLTFTLSLFWSVNLSAGMEMEKTVNFSIIPLHKKQNKKS